MVILTRQRAAEILERARACRVVVLGDVMLDEFIWGDVSRISPEAPVPVVNIKRESTRLGGAANVLANVNALGARASLVGVIGKDTAGEKLRQALQTDEPLIEDSNRPTTIKTRIIAHHQMVVRADREHRAPVNGEIEARLISAAQTAIEQAQALIISDYDKGVVTPAILAQVLPFAHARVPVLIDPKLRNFDAYRPATLVTPNHHEALQFTGLEEDSDDGLHAAARKIRERLGCDAVLITRGDQGMMLVEGDGEPLCVPTVAREVYDVTGAGDTVIATLAAALAAGASMAEASALANHAAGIVVAKLGTATASADEVINSIS